MKRNTLFVTLAALYCSIASLHRTAAEEPSQPAESAEAEQIVVLDVNFDLDPVGQAPESAQRSRAPKDTKIQVISPFPDPADPFSGDDNRSLMFDSSEPLQFCLYSHKPVSRGKLTIDFYTYANASKGYDPNGSFLKIALGNDANGNQTINNDEAACWIDLRENGRIMIRAADGLMYADQTYPANQVNSLEINFDASKQEWSAQINGEQISVGKGKIRSFKFKAPTQSLDTLAIFNQGQNNLPSRVFVDNLRIVQITP